MSLEQVKRIHRVSEMMVTAHAREFELLGRSAFWSDLGLFACNVCLIAVAFADPLALRSYFGRNVLLWIGIASVLVFVFSFAASYMDWRVRAEKHRAAFQVFLDFKFAAEQLIHSFDDAKAEALIDKYRTLAPVLVTISERDFVEHKKNHRLKVFISKYLDEHPAANIWLLRLRLWVFDNIVPILGKPGVKEQ